MAPLERVAALIPPGGEVLEVGCGRGLLTLQLALEDADRRVHGVDISPERIAQAAAAATVAGVADRTTFEVVVPDWSPPADRYDAIVFCDVLYLLGEREIARSVEQACAALRSPGLLVLKEIAEHPRWKHRVARAQELVSVRLLGLTEGDRINPVPLEAATATLDRLGWVGRPVPLHHGYPYSHTVVVARRR